jgi:type IX secretion system PorP/SprF family membrane protein
MPKQLLFLLFLFSIIRLHSQEPSLPPDLRQYNLTQYNSSLFNPVFSLDRNDPQSLSMWVRWQWQVVDADPTTLFANYTHQLNRRSALGIGFLQQNTGLFLQTGGVLNYAYAFDLGSEVTLALGVNLFGYQQELADNSLSPGPGGGSSLLDNGSAFVMQAAPGISLGYENFSLGFAAENLLGYNTQEKEIEIGIDQKIYLGSASYTFDIGESELPQKSFVRPMVYVKSIPGFDTQFGINSLFVTNSYWLQAGYNNFYGLSGGIGMTVLKRLNLGILVEVANSEELTGKEPTFEFVSSFKFKEPDVRQKVVGFEDVEEEVPLPKSERPKKLNRKERKALALAEQQKVEDSIRAVSKQQDSLIQAGKRAAEAENTRLAVEAQRKKDSLEAMAAREVEKAKNEEVVDPEKGERYEEAVLSDDIRPGYYLIVNAFGTEKYYTLFMESLTRKGLNPKSFFRTGRKLNYVYLERYETMKEARDARDSKFFGRYSDTIWIFRVKGE